MIRRPDYRLALWLLLPFTARAKSALESARELNEPAAISVSTGETEGANFWETNAPILRDAWKEWEENQQFTDLGTSLIHEGLQNAVTNAWQNPRVGEDLLRRDLITEVAPGVHRFQLFDPDKIEKIRYPIDRLSSSGIPSRRPNGMNRYGVILSPDVEGAVTLEALNSFVADLINLYARPLGRMLFPEYIRAADDIESYAFTVRYLDGEDVSLREHGDASLITMNVNLNLPNETYTGSSLYFVQNGVKHNVSFSPGTALIHRGQLRHAALPIESGNRNNMIVWLFGEDGYVRMAPYQAHERLSPEQRWSHPSKKDAGNYCPF